MRRGDPYARNPCLRRGPLSLDYWTRLPGFYNCVSSNGYTLAPVLGRLTAEMLAGRQTSIPVAPFLLNRFG